MRNKIDWHAAVMLGLALTFALALRTHAQVSTAEPYVIAAKAVPLVIGSATFQGPAIIMGKQIIQNQSFKTIVTVSKLDSSKVCNNLKIIPLSSAFSPQKKSIFEKLFEWITP